MGILISDSKPVLIYLAGLIAVSVAITLYARLARTHTLLPLFKRFSFLSFPYFILGLALIPLFPGFFRDIFNQAHDLLIMLGVTWIGFHYGSRLDLRRNGGFDFREFLFDVFEPLIVSLVISSLAALFLHLWFKTWQYTPMAFLTGILCSFSFSRARDFIRGKTDSARDTGDSRSFLNLLPVLVLALLEIILFTSKEVTLITFTVKGIPAILLLEMVVALIGGILCNMMLTGTGDTESFPFIMIGSVALLGGLAYAYSLSPLFLGVFSGMFLINTTLKRVQVMETITLANSYIEKVFMFLLGTSMTPLIIGLSIDSLAILCAAAVLVILSAGLKWILTRIWAPVRHREPSHLLWISVAGQGMLAAAAAVECALQARLIPSMFLLFVAMVILNQLSMIAFAEQYPRTHPQEFAPDA